MMIRRNSVLHIFPSVAITLCLMFGNPWNQEVFTQPSDLPPTDPAQRLLQQISSHLQTVLGSHLYQEVFKTLPVVISERVLESKPSGVRTKSAIIPIEPKETEARILSSLILPAGWEIKKQKDIRSLKDQTIFQSLNLHLLLWIYQNVDTLSGTIVVNNLIFQTESHAHIYYRWLRENNPNPTLVYWQGKIVYELVVTNPMDLVPLWDILGLDYLQRIRLAFKEMPAGYQYKEDRWIPTNDLPYLLPWIKDKDPSIQESIQVAYEEVYHYTPTSANIYVYYLFAATIPVAETLALEIKNRNPNGSVLRVNNVLMWYKYD